MQQCAAESDNDEYVFLVSNGNSSGSVTLTVGGVKLDMPIDSGATTNVIGLMSLLLTSIIGYFCLLLVDSLLIYRTSW